MILISVMYCTSNLASHITSPVIFGISPLSYRDMSCSLVCLLHLITMFSLGSLLGLTLIPSVPTHYDFVGACYEKCTYHTKSFSLTAIHIHTGICLFNPVLCCVNGPLETYSLADCFKELELVTVSMCTASFICVMLSLGL